MTRLPQLAPPFEAQSAESFSAHVNALHSEPKRQAKRSNRPIVKTKIASVPKTRPPTPGQIVLELGSVQTTIAYTGKPKSRQIQRSALVQAALALKCEELPLERFLNERYATTIINGNGDE